MKGHKYISNLKKKKNKINLKIKKMHITLKN